MLACKPCGISGRAVGDPKFRNRVGGAAPSTTVLANACSAPVRAAPWLFWLADNGSGSASHAVDTALLHSPHWAVANVISGSHARRGEGT
ncbi:hypothetical protein EON67_02685 [archaeon]|nr:MAG: hypothetical protein EON67_02685 [archaeon]